MGTSQSSSGSPSGVPIIPPWVPEPVPPEKQDGNGQDEQGGDVGNVENDQEKLDPTDSPEPPTSSPALAPPGRFAPARTGLGQYASTGSKDDMRRGIGHYIRRGLGGSTRAGRRFGGSARTAGTLYGALSLLTTGRPVEPGSPLDPTLLEGRSAEEVLDAVVEAVRPIDGTLDTEASRVAIRRALSELLDRFPDADLLNLSEEQMLYAIERYLVFDVYLRLRLDVGKAVQDRAPSAAVALSRMRDILDYVRETIAARFRALLKVGESLSASLISRISAHALRESFEVFEEYVR